MKIQTHDELLEEVAQKKQLMSTGMIKPNYNFSFEHIYNSLNQSNKLNDWVPLISHSST